MTPRQEIKRTREPDASRNSDALAPDTRRARKMPYAPDYVSAETLAHRLDCSKTTVHGYVRRGILPRPIKIGELVRWRWVDVEKTIESLEAGDDSHADANDPYLAGIERGTTQEASH